MTPIRLSEADAEALAEERLRHILKGIPQLIRRPVRGFDGDTALAWIQAGRINEVVERYEKALRYQA